jgi:cell division protein FtsB
VRMEVYLARESKISRLLALEADVEKLSRTNSRLIAQIQRLERESNEWTKEKVHQQQMKYSYSNLCN